MTSLSPARRAAVGRISPVRIGVFSLLLFALICIEFYIGETALTVFYDQLLHDFSYTESKGWQKIAAWFIKEFRRPGYTIEAGSGTNPLPLDQFAEIYRDNLGILVTAALG